MFNPELKINFANDRFKELFDIKGDSPDEKMQELFDKEIYEKIKNFTQTGLGKNSFDWIINTESRKLLIIIHQEKGINHET